VARTYEYSLSVQRELPQNTLVQVAYVGNLGRHILRGESINNPSWTPQGYIPVSPNPNTYACPTGINAKPLIVAQQVVLRLPLWVETRFGHTSDFQALARS